MRPSEFCPNRERKTKSKTTHAARLSSSPASGAPGVELRVNGAVRVVPATEIRCWHAPEPPEEASSEPSPDASDA